LICHDAQPEDCGGNGTEKKGEKKEKKESGRKFFTGAPQLTSAMLDSAM
jgi:hypothetical protein